MTLVSAVMVDAAAVVAWLIVVYTVFDRGIINIDLRYGVVMIAVALVRAVVC